MFINLIGEICYFETKFMDKDKIRNYSIDFHKLETK